MASAHIEWAIRSLKDAGYHLKTAMSDVIQDNPWSEVSRFAVNIALPDWNKCRL